MSDYNPNYLGLCERNPNYLGELNPNSFGEVV